MDIEHDTGPDWYQAQSLLEREQWEAYQAKLKADVAYVQWLDQVEQARTYDDDCKS